MISLELGHQGASEVAVRTCRRFRSAFADARAFRSSYALRNFSAMWTGCGRIASACWCRTLHAAGPTASARGKSRAGQGVRGSSGAAPPTSNGSSRQCTSTLGHCDAWHPKEGGWLNSRSQLQSNIPANKASGAMPHRSRMCILATKAAEKISKEISVHSRGASAFLIWQPGQT